MRPVDGLLLDRAGGLRVAILPMACAPDGEGVPERWGSMGETHFEALGAQAEAVLALTREGCERPAHVDAVRRANLMYFSGGKPDYLYHTLLGTALWQAALEVLSEGGVLAGCSAGAMILGGHMPDVNAFPQIIRWVPAFGLIPNAAVIPHFDEISGPLVSLASRFRPKGSTLIGVEGNTALIGAAGDWEVVGSGSVVIRGGRHAARFTTGASVPLG